MVHHPRAELDQLDAQLELLEVIEPDLHASTPVGHLTRTTLQLIAWGLRRRDGYRMKWKP